jgi:hypothetical protein
MKQEDLIQSIDETLGLIVDVVDEYMMEIQEQLEVTINPEKLLGKPYELWTAQDKILLGQVYGPEPNPLSNLIFNKEYDKVLALEEGELHGI